MEEPTSLTITESAKDTLETHRHPDHESWNDVIQTFGRVLPHPEGIYKDGCANCGETPHSDGPMEYVGGIINFAHAESGSHGTRRDHFITEWFCSRECFIEETDERQKYTTNDPDLARVGGVDALQADVTPSHFQLRQDGSMYLTLEVPGAFSGEPDVGDDYDYIGEPVYVKNRGDWIQSGVIEDIVHEETRTYLELTHDHRVTEPNHPDEERVEEYWGDWNAEECPNCGGEYHESTEGDHGDCLDCGLAELPAEDGITCPECGSESIKEASNNDPKNVATYGCRDCRHRWDGE
jgi:hypothetical protein